MKFVKCAVTVGLILLVSMNGFSVGKKGDDFVISGPSDMKVQTATAKNIIGYLNTLFGGIFPSSANAVLTDFSHEEIKMVVVSWYARIDELDSIVKKLSPKFEKSMQELKNVNRELLFALEKNFAQNIAPAVKKPRAYGSPFVRIEELNFGLVACANMDVDIKIAVANYRDNINHIKKDLDATVHRYLPGRKNTNRARELVYAFADYLSKACEGVQKGLNQINAAVYLFNKNKYNVLRMR